MSVPPKEYVLIYYKTANLILTSNSLLLWNSGCCQSNSCVFLYGTWALGKANKHLASSHSLHGPELPWIRSGKEARCLANCGWSCKNFCLNDCKMYGSVLLLPLENAQTEANRTHLPHRKKFSKRWLAVQPVSKALQNPGKLWFSGVFLLWAVNRGRSSTEQKICPGEEFFQDPWKVWYRLWWGHYCVGDFQ